METFDADWLALREPIDHRSRAVRLVEPLVAAWTRGRWSRVLDLGSGTGSNLRYLAPRLPPGQDWTLVDHDPVHLHALSRLEVPAGTGRLAVVAGDLAVAGLHAVGAAHLVTASALLDLVSSHWVARLVTACRGAGCGALFALSYDGGMRWFDAEAPGRSDDDPDDLFVRTAVNSHQTGNKGLGPALGPAAAQSAEYAFARAGYRCRRQPSVWQLTVADAVLVHRLIDGWASAAAEMQPAAVDRIAAWAARRRATVDRGGFRLAVGHDDLLALPPDRT